MAMGFWSAGRLSHEKKTDATCRVLVTVRNWRKIDRAFAGDWATRAFPRSEKAQASTGRGE
eukprot:29037-Pelagococcus_subviridis.AAC.2